MTNLPKYSKISLVSVVVIALLPMIVSSQEKKEFSYTVGPKAIISITNNYGPITVKPSRDDQVVVRTVSNSEAVSFENQRHGNRIELRSISTQLGNSLVDYTVLVPRKALVSLRSSDGNLHAQGLRGDVILETETAIVEVSDIRDAHLHVKTLSGPVNLTDIRNSNLDVQSVGGNVNIHNVTESSVKVNSGGGRINYDGDPGPAGEYRLTSHAGDLEISIPISASVEIEAPTVDGESDENFPRLDGASALSFKNLFQKSEISNPSGFVLRSFKGKIHVKRP